MGSGGMSVDATGKGAPQAAVGAERVPTAPVRAWQDALIAARMEVQAVDKAGQAPMSAGGYDYVTRDDIVGYAAPLLARHGLALIPAETHWEQATDVSINRTNVWLLIGHGHERRWKDTLPVRIHRDPVKESAAADSYIEKYRYLRVLGIPRSDIELDPDAYESHRGADQ
tara:strand:+ start:13773 stop:14282 length:510 start_codon:yes stop_codon:yes gene_type:complete